MFDADVSRFCDLARARADRHAGRNLSEQHDEHTYEEDDAWKHLLTGGWRHPPIRGVNCTRYSAVLTIESTTFKIYIPGISPM